MSDWELTWVALGLTAVTFLTRTAFLLSDRELPMPGWLLRGFKYAPIAALSAVVVPAVLLTQGHLIDTLKDARIYATLAAALWFWWRGGVLGVIVTGMAVLVPLKVFLGW